MEPKFLLAFLLSTLIVCSSGEKQILRWTRKLTTQHDSLNFPTTTPAIVTVPSATPVTVTPTPASTPVTFPPTTATPAAPVTNPATVPPTTATPAAPVTNPATVPPTTATPAAPVTNPATTPTPVTNPTVSPPATTTAPVAAGQSWCVAKTGAPEKSIQAALDYACGIGGADCATIQQGASCYNPNTLQNHASYAFNSYYQRNPVPTSCDFGGAGIVTTSNPSSGTCLFSTSATTASPVTTSPTVTPPTTIYPVTMNPTPTTASSTGASPTPTGLGIPPSILNSSNPAFGGATTGFGDGSPVANMTPSFSLSSPLKPFVGCIILAASILVLDV